jgi:catechol O-methyltransferase
VKSKRDVQDSPSAVLKAIDEFGRTKKYLMNVGEYKGRIVTNLIQDSTPEIMIELGGYCGYSTILFADAQRAAGGKKYYSLERSPKFAKNIASLVEIAGLSGFVEVIVGPSNEGIQKLYDTGKIRQIGMLFLDHYKPAYTTDLKLCESLGLIKKAHKEGHSFGSRQCYQPWQSTLLGTCSQFRDREKRQIVKSADEGRHGKFPW